jgi:serine/threonine protein kinase
MGGLFETSNIQGELKNIYTKQDVLDYNVYGVTHRCKENKTGNKVAIKIINKKYLEKICGQKNLEKCYEIIRQGVELLKKMEGENSLHLIEFSETNDSFYIITEIWDTDLEKYISDKKTSLTIEEIKNLFKKLNNGLKRMVDNGIIHGNLKLSNILIKTNENNEMIPLLNEFGKNEILDDKLNVMQSTSEYSAPEQLVGENIDNKVDLWSIGIILYKLYFNEFPYNGDTQVALYNDIKKKQKFKKCEENYYFNDLIKKLLITDPNYRTTWEEYFNHKFWEEGKDEKNENLSEKDIEEQNINNELIKKKEYKILFQKNKNLPKDKYYNAYYCLYVENNPNLEDLKKIEVGIDKNYDEGSIDNLIYQEFTQKVDLVFLSKLVLYGCHLKNLDILINLPAPNLIELDLGRNEIENIQQFRDVSYVYLLTLNLSNNLIYDITPLTQAPFKYLRNLYLSHNLITDIEPLSKVPFYYLNKLKLSSNKIRDIEVFTRVPFDDLTYLELKNNLIGESGKALENFSFKELLYLDLSHNLLKTIEGLTSWQFRSLISLDLGDNDISNIDLLSEVYFSGLISLSLYDNNIENGYIFSRVAFSQLKELNLSYNKIENIDFINYVVFENLEKLDLNGNKINDLSPLNQFLLTNLKELQLKYNKLKEFEGNEDILNNLKMNYTDLKILYN